jgi:hypothetical protein
MPLAGLFGSWRAERGRRARAQRYVGAVMIEPADESIRALAAVGDGDDDHARWELRYARRAVGLLVSERDALDDLTASDVAAALEEAHHRDQRIATDKSDIAAQQFNDRLREYRAALADRASAAGTAERLGAVLLSFAKVSPITDAASEMAADLAGAMVTECNAALRAAYGEASLPDDIRPSEL